MTKETLALLYSLLKQAEDTDEFVVYSPADEGPLNVKRIELVDDGKEDPFVMVTI